MVIVFWFQRELDPVYSWEDHVSDIWAVLQTGNCIFCPANEFVAQEEPKQASIVIRLFWHVEWIQSQR